MTASGGWCAPTETVYDIEPPQDITTLAEAVASAVPMPAVAGDPVYEVAGHRELVEAISAAYPSAEPIVFPAPRDLIAADMVENTAQQILAEYPYRTLIDCRQLAARLVDKVLTWDAMWPEAEGDCGCKLRGLPYHLPECIWNGEEGTL